MSTELRTNRDTNDETVVLDPIIILDNNAAELLPANPKRIKVLISVLEEDGFVRLMDAVTQPTVVKGRFVEVGETIEITGAMHTGPISGIVAVGGKEPTFYVTEV